MTEEIKNELTPMFPFGRIGKPRDVAKTIKFLMSDEALDYRSDYSFRRWI